MISLGRTCQRHRSALLDFVDHGEIVEPDTTLAFAHLDRCDRCTVELETTVLAITALRRLGDDVAEVEPSADAWPRLRARLDRWRRARRVVMSPTAGMVMSVAIVAVLIAPLRIRGAIESTGATAAPVDRNPVSLNERRVEADYLLRARHELLSEVELVVRQAEPLPRKYPDNYRPERKEVTPAQPSGRPSEAI